MKEAVFGYRKFYDVLYEKPPLPIFSLNPSAWGVVQQVTVIEIPTVYETNEMPTDPGANKPIAISTEHMNKEPEIAEADQQGAAQLALFGEPLTTKKQVKSTPKSSSPTKTDEELLNDLAYRLKQQGNEEGMLLSDTAKRIKSKTTKQMTELLVSDDRFRIIYGKSKRVQLIKKE